MGVHGLWELLAPVGRRVSVETLAGKRLAIDASIWMIQFMKAMRDDKGEMVRNAHILGFFRRICKLLFLRTKPVFVFDGGTPALKRRTVVARRRQRENAQTKIRKTAEKLLLNHLKTMRLKELAKDLENQRRGNDVKGKKVMTDQLDVAENNLEGNDTISGSYNQEAVDEMLAASLAAEEDGSYDGNTSTSGAGMPIEEEDDDDDEEMILPMVHGKVDPAVLAALPPSMQLDLLVQMRERLMAENRQKYQKVKQAPAKFSELQIQAYLKTVAFRREIDEVQRSAAGKGVGGVQTSRIASESNREFIFSSSFTGDKQMLTSAGVERNSDEQCISQPGHPSESSDKFPSTNKSSATTGSVVDEPTGLFDDGVERYLDERGRLRVSRVRAMGIRMTRDLQRNLDLMKEIEQERTNANDAINNESVLGNNGAGITRKFSNKIQFPEASYQGNDGTNANEQSMSEAGTSMEISFEDNGGRKCVDGEDDLFARLVTGGPVMISSADGTSSMKLSDDSASDCDWEEGIIGKKDSSLTDDVEVKYKLSLEQDGNNDDDEIEWEEGDSDVLCSSQGPAALSTTVSKGVLEEEADFQEAIRRSLNDLMSQKFIDASSEDERYKEATEMTNNSTSNGPLHQESASVEANMQLQNDVLQTNESSCEILVGVGMPDLVGGANILKTNDSSEMQLASSLAVNPGKVEVMTDRPCERYVNSHPEIIRQDASESENLHRKIGDKEPITPIKKKRVHFAVEPLSDTSNDVGHIVTDANGYSGVGSRISDSALVDVPNIVVSDARQNDFEAAYSEEITEQGDSTTKASRVDIDAMQKLEEKNYGSLYEEKDDDLDMSAVKDNREQVEVTEALLEEEMLILGKERADLGEEQRKLERNMESVSSEMFAECQELLQMFGLPYIIAPMEAEAQCAYMELANLVDGVVTDDSDAFLFGAQSVYKNIFDDRKYVETYFLKDIENELGLTREKLIRMALLLGSDYTEGVSGIGIVNAIEVVNAFPEEDGLQKFREWIESPDPTILGKFNVQTGSSLKNRSSKVGNNDTSCSVNSVEGDSTADHNNASEFMDSLQKTKQIFMDKHRNVSKNWHIPSSFPSEAVISAYASPQVDKSTEPFSWGKPDHFVLRKLCWEKFGWASQKADELLIPVLKEYGKHETQLRLEAFYTFNERFAKIRSKRIKKAIKGIAGNKSLVLMDDSRQGTSESRKKRKLSPSDSGKDKSGKPSGRTDDGSAGDEKNSTEKSIAKKSRKKKNGDAESSAAGNAGPQMGKERSQKTNKGSSARGRGRGRDLAFRSGRRKENSGLEDSETSSNDENDEKEVQVEKLVASHGTRRSTRLRKAVKYAVDDLEIDERGKSDQDGEKSTNEKAVDEEPLSNHDLAGDAAASPSRKNQHKDGDPSVEGLCGEYLEMGGGFCMGEVDDEEGGHIYSGQDVDDPSFAPLSKDYLKMGGGFCLDEDEVEKEPDILATIAENADTSHHSGFMEEVDNDDIGQIQLVSSPRRALDGLPKDIGLGHSNITPNENHFKVDTSPSQCNKEADSETGSVRFLSAMPNLRRKRKKN